MLDCNRGLREILGPGSALDGVCDILL